MDSYTLAFLSLILMIAAISCLVMWRKGHFYVIAPFALPLAWMSFGCILRSVGSLDHDDFAIMMGVGLFVLSMNIIIGTAVYAYTRVRK